MGIWGALGKMAGSKVIEKVESELTKKQNREQTCDSYRQNTGENAVKHPGCDPFPEVRLLNIVCHEIVHTPCSLQFVALYIVAYQATKCHIFFNIFLFTKYNIFSPCSTA